MGVEITTQSSIKVLGLTFDHNLTWEPQIRNVGKKAIAKLFALRKIRKHFDTSQFTKVLTTQFFSALLLLTCLADSVYEEIPMEISKQRSLSSPEGGCQRL